MLLAAVVVTGWLLITGGDSAEERAEAYLRALAAGDLAAVQATGIELSADAASAFSGAGEHVEEAAVEAVSVSDSTGEATAFVTYTLGGERVDAAIDFIRQSNGWVPTAQSALGTVQIAADSPVSIGEVVVAGDATAALLPAVYDVAAAPTDLLDGSATIVVHAGAAIEQAIESSLRPAAGVQAQQQLDAYLDDCTAPAEEVPTACGLVIPWAADLSSVSQIGYRIERHPIVALAMTSFTATDGDLVATVTGTAHDGATRTLTYRTQNWTVRGDVSFTADDVILSVW